MDRKITATISGKAAARGKKKRMRFFRRKVLLQKLGELGAVAVETLFEAMSGAEELADIMLLPYHASYSAMRASISGRRRIDEDEEWRRYAEHMRRAFSVQISRLKKEGLVSGDGKGIVAITKDGRDYARIMSPTPPWFKAYPQDTSRSRVLKLVIFDIPESQRIQRDWLRYHLGELGYECLQRSVWWGTSALPEAFIADLQEYHMMPHIHIFSDKKGGTISELLERVGRKRKAAP